MTLRTRGDRHVVAAWGIAEKAFGTILAFICTASLVAVLGMWRDVSLIKRDLGYVQSAVQDHELRIRSQEHR